MIDEEIEGVRVRFDENAVRDLKALCHAAYSPLYTGDALARTGTLGLAECLHLGVDTLFPANVQPGVANNLTVVATDLDLPGSFSPLGQAGLRIELNPIGGTVGAFAGTTNADGVFQTTATAFPGQPQLTIEVVVRSSTGEELARRTVHAVVAGGPDVLGIWQGGGTCGDTFVSTTLRITRSVEGPLAASVAATGLTGSGNGIQRVYGTWLLDENEDGTFSSDQTVSGLPDTIRLRLRPDAVFEGRVQGDPRLGPCRDFGGAFDFTATRIPG
jgi:hypothetical protein